MEVDMAVISEKGQVVIPSDMRREMRIRKSDRFYIFGEGDTIILKKIEQAPFKKRLSELTSPLQKVIEKEGFARNDLTQVIKHVRQRA